MKCSPISSFFVLSMVFMFRLIDTATVFEAEENKNNFSMASLAYMYHFKVYGFPTEEDAMNDDPHTPPEILSKPEDVSLNEGDSYILPCKLKDPISGNQFAQVWARSNNNSLFVDDYKTSNSSHFERLPDGSLNIKNFTKDLADRYSCSFGPVSISHTVGYKVSVEIGHMQKIVDVGGDLRLSCKADSYPKPKVIWQRQTANGMETVGESADVVIRNVDTSYSGVYSCVAFKSENEIPVSKNVTVTVINGIKAENKKVYAVAGKEARLCCIISKSDNIKESNWLKMGKDIRDLMILGNRYNTEIHGKTKLCLIINQVKEEDLGEFTCGIIKSYGTGDSNKHNVDHISLSGEPEVPVLISVSVNEETQMPKITWNVTTFLPLLWYRVYVRKQADESGWQLNRDVSLVTADLVESITVSFDDLNNGQYYVKLVVKNKYGVNEYISTDPILVVDKLVNTVLADKNVENGTMSSFSISFSCILFAVVTRLWIC